MKRKHTASANESLVVLLVHVDGLGDRRIKRTGPLFQDLLSIVNLLLRALHPDLHSSRGVGCIIGIGNVNLSTGVGAQLVHLTAALADERGNLALGYRDSG